MSNPDARRIAVVGMGAVTPLGNDLPTTWAGILAGRSGVGTITQFDPSDLRTRIAAEVKDFDPTRYVEVKEARRMDRFVHFAIAATQEAIADSGLDLSQEDPRRVGVLIGSAVGGIHVLLEQIETMQNKGTRRVSPFAITGLMLNAAAGQVSIMLGVRGPSIGLATACATGSHSLGEAAEIIRRGDADVMVAGGSEAGIVPIAIAAFDSMHAVSSRNDEPERASRPFDADRDGFVVGEGAGIMILERMDRARARGARIYAELLGYGATDDAFHIAQPAEGGEGAVESMRAALRAGNLRPEDVDYINAHGTSTRLNDAIETQAIKTVFGQHAYNLAVSSTKSMIGHLLGAAGAVEAIACAMAIHEQVLPPTINYETPDPDCDLDYVPNVARPAEVNVCLSNSFGLGGHNGTVALRRADSR
ncbi:MAG: beta-ketoacyl-ACP synthase II [Anaerolineae bacterium]